MKRHSQIFVLSLAVLLGSGCDKGSISAGGTSKARPEATFELRDFDTQQSLVSGSSVFFNGRGTVLTKDPWLQSGKYVVYLSASQEGEHNPSVFSVLLESGTGTLKTTAMLEQARVKETGPVKYSKWQVLGYQHLPEATVVANSSEKADSKPRLQVRDYRVADIEEFGDRKTRASGMVVALDAEMKKGVFIILMQGRDQQGNSIVEAETLMKDGIGNFDGSVRHGGTREPASWIVHATLPLIPAQVVAPDASTPAKPSTPRLQVRDLTVESKEVGSIENFLSMRATLVALDEDYKKRPTDVFLLGKTAQDTKTFKASAQLKDGVAQTSATRAYMKGGPAPSDKIEWEAYFAEPLLPAKLIYGTGPSH